MTDRDSARRTYELYKQRGCEHGRDMDDWLQAERELVPRAAPPSRDFSEGHHEND
jgi:DUF2934 family protein